MSELSVNRFEWLKGALQSPDLNSTAKALASALAVQFTNDETGQTNPKVTTLAEFLGMSVATVKRAIVDLVKARWLHRTEGRGNGNRTRYTLVSPGKIVRFRARQTAKSAPEKGAEMTPFTGSDLSLQANSKGSDTSFHRLKSEPSYIEQSLEQKGAPADAFRNHTFTGNAFPGPILIKSSDHEKLGAWGRWLRSQGFPALSVFNLERSNAKKGSVYLALPWRTPPDRPDMVAEARAFFAQILDEEGARHAAQ